MPARCLAEPLSSISAAGWASLDPRRAQRLRRRCTAISGAGIPTLSARVPVACESVEHSVFIGRPFHRVLAWGFILLQPESRQSLIRRTADCCPVAGCGS